MLGFLKAEVETANRVELLMMLYEGCIKFINSAIEAIESNNIKEFCENLSKAMDIVLELINSLDFNVEGDLPHMLAQVYHSIIYFLIEANLKRRKDELIVAKHSMEKIFSAFQEISKADADNLNLPELPKTTFEECL